MIESLEKGEISMVKRAPKLVAINHDEYHARHVGRTADGRQFFLTTPFIPGKREFLALYLFDGQGNLLDARIDDLGMRGQLNKEHVNALIEARLAELGDVTFQRIKVAPFRVERFGTEFGLISQAPEDDGDDWRVSVEPGDYMVCYPPWDGDYDT
jgi:hypothetical protein